MRQRLHLKPEQAYCVLGSRRSAELLSYRLFAELCCSYLEEEVEIFSKEDSMPKGFVGYSKYTGAPKKFPTIYIIANIYKNSHSLYNKHYDFTRVRQWLLTLFRSPRSVVEVQNCLQQ